MYPLLRGYLPRREHRLSLYFVIGKWKMERHSKKELEGNIKTNLRTIFIGGVSTRTLYTPQNQDCTLYFVLFRKT